MPRLGPIKRKGFDPISTSSRVRGTLFWKETSNNGQRQDNSSPSQPPSVSKELFSRTLRQAGIDRDTGEKL